MSRILVTGGRRLRRLARRRPAGRRRPRGRGARLARGPRGPAARRGCVPTSRWCRATCATRGLAPGRPRRSRCATRRPGGPRRRLRRRRPLRGRQRRGHGRGPGGAARARLRGPAGAGVEHGRLRRGPLPLRRPRRRAAWRPRAGDDLDAGRFEPPCPRCGAPLAWAPSTRTPRSTPATCTPPPSSTRSTCAPLYGREHGAVAALRYHNVYGPRMPRDTPYAGVASIFRSAVARGEPPRCSRTAGRPATSSTSPTSPGPTWPR